MLIHLFPKWHNIGMKKWIRCVFRKIKSQKIIKKKLKELKDLKNLSSSSNNNIKKIENEYIYIVEIVFYIYKKC